MLASLEVFRVPVSVRSIAISLRLRAAWILDWKDKNGEGLSKHIIKYFNYKLIRYNKRSKNIKLIGE